MDRDFGRTLGTKFCIRFQFDTKRSRDLTDIITMGSITIFVFDKYVTDFEVFFIVNVGVFKFEFFLERNVSQVNMEEEEMNV